MGDGNDGYILFGGRSHQFLSQEVADSLGVVLGQCRFTTFPDGELFIQILENVRGRDVFVLQSLAGDPNGYLVELLLMIDALKRASARSICAVIPYLAYSRQDRKDRPRVAIAARLMANIIERAGASRVLTMDLHADQLQGFFDIPLDNLYARPVLLEAFKKLKTKEMAVVAPDVGSIKMARAFAGALDCELAVVDKRRLQADQVEVCHIIGDVRGKEILLVDDICSTASTLCMAAAACMQAGAASVIAGVTHALLADQALEKLEKSCITKLIVANTIPGTELIKHSKIEVVSVASLFSEAIRCIISARSISSLFSTKGAELVRLVENLSL